jgi:hypothetical protein
MSGWVNLRERGYKGVFAGQVTVEKGREPSYTVQLAAWKIDKKISAKESN